MRKVGPEAYKNFGLRQKTGFFKQYLSGSNILDIGYRGGSADALPITESAVGVDLDYPGYDGRRLPFANESQDAIFASHCLEHIAEYRLVLADWYRVLKVGGYLLVMVPHRDLYERKASPPSRFNEDHKRFYTAASLLTEVEESLPIGGFRIRSLKDMDDQFDYSLAPEIHAKGSYEIELVLEKILQPAYADRLRMGSEAKALADLWASTVIEIKSAEVAGDASAARSKVEMLLTLALPPFPVLFAAIATKVNWVDVIAKDNRPLQWLRTLLTPAVRGAPFDEPFYLTRYTDIAQKAATLGGAFAHQHYIQHGYFEGRFGHPKDLY